MEGVSDYYSEELKEILKKPKHLENRFGYGKVNGLWIVNFIYTSNYQYYPWIKNGFEFNLYTYSRCKQYHLMQI